MKPFLIAAALAAVTMLAVFGATEELRTAWIEESGRTIPEGSRATGRAPAPS